MVENSINHHNPNPLSTVKTVLRGHLWYKEKVAL